MTLDYKNYNYIPDATNPRLLTRVGRNQTSTESAWVAEPMRQFAERILSKFPKWQCVRDYGFMTMDVYAGTEFLGWVSVRSCTNFEIENKRIRAKRTRRGGMKTKDADRAFKLVCKYFKTDSNKERFTEAARSAGGWISNEVNTTYGSFRAQFSYLTFAAKDLIMKDLATYMEAAKTSGLDISKVSGVEDFYQRSQEAKLFDSCLQKNMGSVVLRTGSGYLVGDPEGTQITSLDDALLSTPMRLALGKLKLVEPRTIVEGAGFRLDEDTFYVVV